MYSRTLWGREGWKSGNKFILVPLLAKSGIDIARKNLVKNGCGSEDPENGYPLPIEVEPGKYGIVVSKQALSISHVPTMVWTADTCGINWHKETVRIIEKMQLRQTNLS
jgi:hypothetical protein